MSPTILRSAGKLLLIGVVLCIALGPPALAGKFSTPCAKDTIQKNGRYGALCVGLCGNGADVANCTPGGSGDLALGTEKRAPLEGPPERLWIRILGKGTTLELLGNQFGALTGWKVRVPKGFEDLKLQPGSWKGAWADLAKVRWKASEAGRVRIVVDDAAKMLTFSVHI